MDWIGPMFCLLLALQTMQATATHVQGSHWNAGEQRDFMRPRRSANRGTPKTTSGLIRELLKDYHKEDPPSKDASTRVSLGIYVISFHSVSEQNMDYSISMYLRQSWKDERLKFKPLNSKIDSIKMDGKWNDIWLPDVFFHNEKRANFHDVTVENRLLKLNSTGHLWYVTRISATLSCPMMLQRYPFDTQICPMKIETFGNTMDTMYYSWLSEPVKVDPQVQLPQFSLQDTILHDCTQNYTGGSFPCLEIRFILRRDFGFFLIQVYVPSILIVILSWLSFWINVDAVTARVILGVFTILTMATQSGSANSSLPRVSYIKAIDVWMFMCLIFVFTALLEFAVVNVISSKGFGTLNPFKRPPPAIRRKESDGYMDQTEDKDDNGGDRKENSSEKISDPEGKQKARRIDQISRIVFPLAFLVFNFIYWIVYTVP